MNRGRRSESIFSDKHDYLLFIELLIELSEMFNVKVAAYCLMTNHYHILLQTPEGNISRCVRHLNSVYTQRYNSSHGFDGQLFSGRYKSILVCNDSHLLQLVRYIHKNPVRAGIVKDMPDYEWNSYKGYLSYAKKWNWLPKSLLQKHPSAIATFVLFAFILSSSSSHFLNYAMLLSFLAHICPLTLFFRVYLL